MSFTGKFLGVFTLICFSSISITTANASIIIDFEDATPYSINWVPTDYKGLNWGSETFGVLADQAGSYSWEIGYKTTLSNSYGATSGKYAAYNPFGENRSLQFNGAVNFIGANFTSWAFSNQYGDASARSLNLIGYRN